ncbi:MAG: 3-phosphoglycerate dehydrogenase [Chloroflexota bacterium]|nr:MAG: 3-phosphoglycerate dehydrogenase [Chloroflexota bacterium]HDD60966.1 3-phosphoglycerate dehydrogenase [Chloroflexota bacterium]
MKVLICDATDPKALKLIEEAGIEVVNQPDITPEELLEVISEYPCMVVRSRTKVTKAVLDAGTSLKSVVRAGVGLDNIDVAYAQEKGIKVLNTPSASTQSVAELTIAYLMALARNIPLMTASMKAGKWEKKSFVGSEVSGKTLGLIGSGRIGSAVADRAIALGMTVVAFDPYVTELPNITLMELDELLARADYISLHVPHTDETHNILDAAAFDKVKPGIRIINCGRGGTIDEDALYQAIQDGKVAGAALDVYAEEPLADPKLYSLDQVIGSPHIGAGTKEAKARVGEVAAQKVIETLKG